MALLWTDLDAEAKAISVTKQVNRIKGELVVSQPKTQNSIRTLAVPQQAVDLLVEEHKSVFPYGSVLGSDPNRKNPSKHFKSESKEKVLISHEIRTFCSNQPKRFLSDLHAEPLSGQAAKRLMCGTCQHYRCHLKGVKLFDPTP